MAIVKAIQAHYCRLKKPTSQFEETPVMAPPFCRDGNKICSSTEWRVLRQGKTAVPFGLECLVELTTQCLYVDCRQVVELCFAFV